MGRTAGTAAVTQTDVSWIRNKPTKPRWDWYKDPDLNMGRPMPAWIFDSNRLFYANLGQCGSIMKQSKGMQPGAEI